MRTMLSVLSILTFVFGFGLALPTAAAVDELDVDVGNCIVNVGSCSGTCAVNVGNCAGVCAVNVGNCTSRCPVNVGACTSQLITELLGEIQAGNANVLA